MARERGSVRYHRGGWELRVQLGGQRYAWRHPGPDTRKGRVDAEAALDRHVDELLAARRADRPRGGEAPPRVLAPARRCAPDRGRVPGVHRVGHAIAAEVRDLYLEEFPLVDCEALRRELA